MPSAAFLADLPPRPDDPVTAPRELQRHPLRALLQDAVRLPGEFLSPLEDRQAGDDQRFQRDPHGRDPLVHRVQRRFGGLAYDRFP